MRSSCRALESIVPVQLERFAIRNIWTDCDVTLNMKPGLNVATHMKSSQLFDSWLAERLKYSAGMMRWQVSEKH